MRYPIETLRLGAVAIRARRLREVQDNLAELQRQRKEMETASRKAAKGVARQLRVSADAIETGTDPAPVFQARAGWGMDTLFPKGQAEKLVAAVKDAPVRRDYDRLVRDIGTAEETVRQFSEVNGSSDSGRFLQMLDVWEAAGTKAVSTTALRESGFNLRTVAEYAAEALRQDQAAARERAADNEALFQQTDALELASKGSD